ncbi:MAG TPA: hypothetical protein VKA77_17685 [Mycobacterium sp.]|nr:hypothetical protein [Mycobacterium sp.]
MPDGFLGAASADADALRADLRRVAEASGMPLTGGEVHDDTLLLTEFFGTRTGGMRGLAVLPSAGQNVSRSSRRRSRVICAARRQSWAAARATKR